MRQKSYERVSSDTKAVTKFRDSISSQKRLEKALELIGALDHDKTFRLYVCVFLGGREEINIMWKSC